MDQPVLIRNAAEKLCEYFEDEMLHTDTYELLHKNLTQRIAYLLLNEMEKLLQLLYRVDVAEQDVKGAFAQNNPSLIAPRLAELVIRRELKKAETRLAHRNPKMT